MNRLLENLLIGLWDGLSWGTKRNGHPRKLMERNIYLLMDLSTTCDLHCVHCFRNTYMPAPRTMTTKELRTLEEQVFPYVNRLAFSETAEALHVRQLPEALSAARNAGVPFIRIQSNGTHLNEDIGRILLDHRLDVLGVSLDAAKSETFERIRCGAKWSEVTTNVRNFIRLRNARSGANTRVALNYSLMNQNADEAIAFVHLAKEMGADSISFAHLMIEREEMRAWSLIFQPEETNRLFSQLRGVAKRLGIPISVPKDLPIRVEPFTGVPNGQPVYLGRCEASLDNWLYLMANGSCFPCLNLQDCGPLGNVFETPFRDLWLGERNQAFRHRAVEDHCVEGCDHCKIFIPSSEAGNEMAYLAKRLTTRTAVRI